MQERKIREKDYDFTIHDSLPAEGYCDGKYLPIWAGAKFEATRAAAKKIIESYPNIISKEDFWILTNKHKHTGAKGVEEKLIYSGVIITHDALLKINDTLGENRRFDQRYCTDPVPFSYGDKKGMLMFYRDERDGMFEVGEITTENCKSGYPYAMLLKRTFDRVVRRKAKILGIYSDTEVTELESLPIDPETGELMEDRSRMKESVAPKEPVGNTEPEERPILSETSDYTFQKGPWAKKKVKEVVPNVAKLVPDQKKVIQLYITNSSMVTEEDFKVCQTLKAAYEETKQKRA